MPRSSPACPPAGGRRLLPWVCVVVAALSLGACGDDPKPVVLSEDGKRGERVVRTNGCQFCHTATGKRSTGPTWKDLAGSEVELTDGRKVVADDAYLVRSITDPTAEVPAGYSPTMQPYQLSQEDLEAVLAYLHDLSGKDE